MSGRGKRPAKRSKKDDLEDEVVSEEASVSEDEDVVVEEEEKPKKKRAPPKPKKALAAFTDESGWSLEPPSLLYKSYKSPKPNEKIAAFDLDGTMVNVKSTAKFPRDAEDYKWFNKHVISKIQSYHDAGYKVVIFTNQGGIKSAVTGKMAEKVKGRIDNVMKELAIPAQVFAATLEDKYRKPEAGMWDFMCGSCNGGVQPDKSQCFYVGDAAGRPADFSDSDKGFAAAAGIAFRTPEEEFGEGEGKKALPTEPAKGGKKGEAAEGVVAKVAENQALVDAFAALAERYFEQANREGGNVKFKAISAKKVTGVLASYGDKITKGNLKEVGKLQGVGKGSIAKIQEFLETGKLAELEGVDDLAGVGKAAPAIKDVGKDIANKFM